MLRSLKSLERFTVRATDGDIGTVANFLLDDERWVVRYLVVQAGGPLFLDGRMVLISPISFRQADWATKRFHLALTMDKVQNSPSIDTEKPVSRQNETNYHRYYGHAFYWAYSGLWGMGDSPGALSAILGDDVPDEQPAESSDIHLRSARKLRGYHIHGSDAAIGHVEDFIVDDESWKIHYLVIDTSNWWLGKKVLVAPQWATEISWQEETVHLDMSRQTIKNSPEWDPNAAIERDYENRLYDYYGRSVYWNVEDQSPGLSSHHQSTSPPRHQ